MKTSKIIVICPFSRPEFAQNVFNNFKQQTFQNKELVIVENGTAIGTWQYQATVVLQSDHHQASAKNKALEFVNDKFNGNLWVVFDDDDTYGPNYLSEIVEHSDKGDVIGKLNIFMRPSNGKLRLMDYGAENQLVEMVHGHTIASWINDIEFPNTGLWGEDLAFEQIAKSKGAKIYATSRFNCCYNRHGKNTYRNTDQNFVNVCKSTIEMDYDESIFNGIKQMDGCVIQKTMRYDFSPIEELIEYGEFENFVQERLCQTLQNQ